MDRIDRFFRKNQGSISVLLAIIMLPTLLFSGLIIDVANRQMSKAMVESAGELAMSSALANYDSVLEDVYGLFAVSQDYNDLKDNVAQYMRDTLSAQGLLEGTDYGSDLINGAMGLLDEEVGELGHNFINASVEVTTAKGLAGSALSKPEVMKSQIVEFMKYRGIQVAAQDLLSTLKQFKSLGEKEEVAEKKMEVAKKQEELSDAAQAFYQALVRMDENLKKVEEAYDNIKDKWGIQYSIWYDYSTGQSYYIAQYDPNSVFGYLWTANVNIVAAADPVNLPDNAIWYVAITGSYIREDDNERITLYRVKNGSDEEQSSSAVPSTNTLKNKNTDQLAADLNHKFDDLEETANDILETGTGFFSVTNETISRVPDAGAYLTYKQFINLANEYTTYIARLKELIDEYEEKTEPTQEETDKLTEWKRLYNRHAKKMHLLMKSVVNQSGVELSDITNNSGYSYSYTAKEYLEALENARKKAGENIANAQKLIKPYYEAIDHALNDKDNINGWQRFWNSGKQYFDNVLDLGEKVKTSVTNVKTSNKDYGDAIGVYEGANGTDDYSAQMSSDHDANEETININDVNELLDQVKAIKKFLEAEKTALDNDIYGKKVDYKADYAGANKTTLGKGFIDSARQDVVTAKTIIGTQDLQKLYTYTFWSHIHVKMYNTEFTRQSYVKQIKERRQIANEYVPVPKFYLYLVQTYGYDTSSENSTPSSNMETASDKQPNNEARPGVQGDSSTFSGLTLSSTGATDGTELSDEQKGSGRSKLLTQFKAYGDLFKGIIHACKNLGNIEEIRDDLLVTTYIYENFSNYLDTKKSESEYRVTLTQQKISPQNNALFGCETEYILYGDKSNPKDNIGVVKGNIFAIRFISNSIFAICDGTINAYTLSPALAIQAATMGIFPYKVAQVVLDLILALAESVYDMNEIMKGEKVPLFKNIETWVCQPSGVAKILQEAAVDGIKEAAKELKDELQELVNNSVDNLAENINTVAENITENAATTLRGYVEQAFSSISQIIASELTAIINQVYTGGAPENLSRDTIANKLKEAVHRYINQASSGDKPSINGDVATFLNNHVDGIVNAVMDTSITYNGQTYSVTSLLEEVNQQYQDLINTDEVNTISVNASYFENLLKAVSVSLIGDENHPNSGYINSIKGEIDTTVKTWTSNLGKEVKDTLNDYIEEGVDTLCAEATEAVSNAIDDTIGQYFPAESKMDFSKEGTSSGGTLGDMFKFGYADYLRLFLFLSVSNDSKENEMLMRVGDAITINRVKGLKSYYTKYRITAASSSYTLTKSYTYLVIAADVTVKPTILGSGWFSDDGRPLSQASNTMTGSSFWTYQYATTGGY